MRTRSQVIIPPSGPIGFISHDAAATEPLVTYAVNQRKYSKNRIKLRKQPLRSLKNAKKDR